MARSHQALVPVADVAGGCLKLSFRVPYRTEYGQDVAMVGSSEQLGNWDPSRAMGMRWSEGDVWTVDLEVAPGPHVELEYKYVIRQPDGSVCHWKPGENCSFSLSSVAPLVLSKAATRGSRVGGVAVRDVWDPADGRGREVDVHLVEAVGGDRLSEEDRVEQDAFREQLGVALDELSSRISGAEELGGGADDPTLPHLLAADREIAVATRKCVAFAQALNASMARSRLTDLA